MTTDPTSLSGLVALIAKEGKRRIVTLSAIFSVVALLGLVVALLLPKRYEASTLILVEANNIIKPLMEGRAVPTSVADQTAVVNQIVLGRKVMREILAFGGWVQPPPAHQPDPREEERMLSRLRQHIKIESTRDEMVHISFSDDDPKRTYRVANKITEIYLRESQAGQERESREAFEFIDKQVKEYGDKLGEIHQKVLEQYSGRTTTPVAVEPGATPAVRPKVSAEELAQLRTEEALLEAQITRKPAGATSPRTEARNEEQLRSRVVQLMGQLDQLSSQFTDEHPDVKRVKRELAGAKDELARAEEVSADREASAQLASRLDDDVARAAKSRLEEVRRRIALATNTPLRHGPTARQPAIETVDPEMRGVGRDTTLSELLRRYEATRETYQDLLKRRDNARVSMELDAQHRGFTMRVQEPAELPASASGLRLMHLTLIALFVAVMVPLGVLFAIVRLDQRVRSPHQIERLVPLLGSISYSPTHREKSKLRSRTVAAGLMITCVFVAYVAAFLFKMKTT
jgi:protein tyrosine kinase modulator